KIMDFGIAKLTQQETSLTQTGMTLGTAAYLAPEQIRGEPVDLRTDIFSFGVLAYELLAYERPFKGKQISVVLHQIIDQEPEPLIEKWPAAPAEILTLVDRCLRKNPSQRFADGSELLRAIEVIQKQGRSTRQLSDDIPTVRMPSPSPPAPAPPVRPTLENIELYLNGDRSETPEVPAAAPEPSPRRPGLPALATIVVVAVLAVAGGWWLGTRGSDTQVTGDGDGQAPTVADPPDLSGSSELSDKSSLPEVDDPPPPPAPPPPARLGTVELKAADWTDQMTVDVGGKSYPLLRRWRIELPPGTYDAVFRLTLADYRRQAAVRVEVGAGRTTTLESPIPRPGALSVRPFPAKPRGEVWRAGQRLGPSPITRILIEPGRCTIEIRPAGGDGETVEWQGSIISGQETVLSFDLEDGTVRESTKPLS
ncbi:MAG: serine/threonine-protein kinase, partial [Thermoanaerobaculia bacterium]